MPHHDASTFTINIALNRVGVDYEVSGGHLGPGAGRGEGWLGSTHKVVGQRGPGYAGAREPERKGSRSMGTASWTGWVQSTIWWEGEGFRHNRAAAQEDWDQTAWTWVLPLPSPALCNI